MKKGYLLMSIVFILGFTLDTNAALVGWDYGPLGGLVKIDTATGGMSRLTNSPHVQIEALAFNSTNQTLYGVINESGDNQLVTINPVDGTISPVGYISGFSEITSMTFDEVTETIFALDQITRALLAIDPITASPTTIGHYSFGSSNALAADPNSGQLYGSLMGILGAINKSTGAFSTIGDSGLNGITGLDFMPSSNVLYGVGQIRDGGYQSFIINTTTGQPSFIGNPDLPQITSIEFIDYAIPEPATMLLFGGGLLGAFLRRRAC